VDADHLALQDAAMPLTGLLLAIQGVSEFCKSLDAAINGRWADGAAWSGT
jgi:TRAP-type mannitol/chloroaromatic compound transport system permease small subunit